jgi:membrane protein implicated in regulation of membrane protease activity
MLVFAVAVPQATLSLAGDCDTGITLAIWIMLAMVLAGAGVLVLAAVLAEVSDLLFTVSRLRVACLGLWRRIRRRAGDLPANVPVGVVVSGQ